MYRKVRLRLTKLFTLVISILLTALLCVSFYLSVRQQFSLQLSSFTGQSNTVIESIGEQNILTAGWLTAMEESAGFRIYLWDNEAEFFHNRDHSNRIPPVYSRYLPAPSDGRTLRQAAGTANVSIGCHGIVPEILYYHRQIIKNGSLLRVCFLQSLEPLYAHIRTGLFLSIALFIGSECLLILFCWYFTGRLLQPLLDSQTSQNRFIASVSHELRTPLAVILANASACAKAPAAEQEPFFQVIAREGAQMSAMLEQLLTLSRADSHGLTLQTEQTDLQTLLLEIYENYLPLTAESGHRLDVRLPEAELPLCACDPSRIRQVCHILLHNALSYTPAGSQIVLFIADGAYEKEISIGVRDNGPGIPEDEREKIFERFYRGRRPQRPSAAEAGFPEEKGHHGLGLAVAKEIAGAHKGRLTVTEAPDGGAMFLLTLPL